jgi:hypothetical protein
MGRHGFIKVIGGSAIAWSRAVRTAGAAAHTHDNIIVVNADDFGMSNAVNSGIIRSFEDGLISSAPSWPLCRLSR